MAKSNDVDSSSVLFHGVNYLGAASITDARDEAQVRNVMKAGFNI